MVGATLVPLSYSFREALSEVRSPFAIKMAKIRNIDDALAPLLRYPALIATDEQTFRGPTVGGGWPCASRSWVPAARAATSVGF
jgi:hypothetical protein